MRLSTSDRSLWSVLLAAGLGVAAIACSDDHRTGLPDNAVDSVSVTPGPSVALEVGDSVRLTATAFDRLGRPLQGSGFVWGSADETVASVSATGLVRGLRAGTTWITALTEGAVGRVAVTVEASQAGEPMVEARALWISRFDWTTAADVRALVDSAAAAGFNIVYFQVRGNADAFYQPGMEPWGRKGTAGPIGQHPGFDALAVALERARVHGLELHAWLNAFVFWNSATPPNETTPRHAFLEHPDWLLADPAGQPIVEGASRFMSPARAAARTRLAGVAADLLRRYGLNGIHLDYIRYPSRLPHDAASLAAFDSARSIQPGLTFDEFRRGLVTATVREVMDSLRAVRPAARLSAAVWGIYRNDPGWSAVSTGYDDRLQDARDWARLGIIDVLVPMVYWTIKPTYGERLDFAYLADGHARAVADRHVYVGLYVQANPNAGRSVAEEVNAEIERTREAGAEGVSVFSAQLLRQSNAWEALAAGAFRRRATVPPMPWRGEGQVARGRQ